MADGTVLDFWRWTLGDLRMNTARGFLAEYLVARAVADPSETRVEWGPWDVRGADGTLIEVKACGRLQSWTSTKLSTPVWNFKSVNASRVWSEASGSYEEVVPADRVHVWVFALQTAIEPHAYDPLDLKQWEFRVVPHRTLLKAAQSSARVSFFERQGISPITYARLAEAIQEARQRNDSMSDVASM
ncbi:MAG: hypothetical protein Q7T55_10255 [Solirubrobacteraceae bacterium]|nr:hypothetical protein [Solirubrobacteraceae bacterium]